eukprot:TRINITY_DN2040_c0_g1_i10.p2 TRINITY_DN2040_c0_g1~~TRINITY_DN2040_c0_g1_i10.p2  ORF type:complete len:129 (-),score=6.12 TRINITY_DN2040_c0_g1_i10:287-673(-)
MDSQNLSMKMLVAIMLIFIFVVSNSGFDISNNIMDHDLEESEVKMPQTESGSNPQQVPINEDNYSKGHGHDSDLCYSEKVKECLIISNDRNEEMGSQDNYASDTTVNLILVGVVCIVHGFIVETQRNL